MKKPNYLMLLTVGFGLLASTLFGQQETTNKAKINITVTKDGKTENITKEIDLDDDAQAQMLMEELKALENIDVKIEDGQVKVKVFKDGEENYHVFDMNNEDFFANKSHYFAANKAYLGVRLKNAEGSGAEVLEVIEGTAAEKSGLLKGDIITEFDGKDVTDYKSFIAAMKDKKAGDDVSVKVKRDGKTKKLKAELTENDHHKFAMNSLKKMEYNFDNLKDMDVDVRVLADQDFKDRGYAGFSYQYGDDELKVLKVVEDTPAKEADMRAGDMLKKIDGIELQYGADVRKALSGKKPGDKVVFTLERDGKEITKELILTERKGMDWAGTIDFDRNVINSNNSSYSIIVRTYSLSEDERKIVGKALNMDDYKGNNFSEIDLNVYPNPGNGDYRVDFKLPEEGDVEIQVFDNSGKQVYQLLLEDFSGEYSGNINISDQPAGIYFLTIKQGDKVHSEKLIRN